MPADNHIDTKIAQLLGNGPLLLIGLQPILRSPVNIKHHGPGAILPHGGYLFLHLFVECVQPVVLEKINQWHGLLLQRDIQGG